MDISIHYSRERLDGTDLPVEVVDWMGIPLLNLYTNRTDRWPEVCREMLEKLDQYRNVSGLEMLFEFIDSQVGLGLAESDPSREPVLQNAVPSVA